MITFPRFMLLSLALFGDIVAVLPKSERQSVDFWLGERAKFHKKKSILNTVSRLLKAAEIDKVIENGRVKLQITPKGLKSLGTINFNLEKFSKRSWDGKWRSVIFDIEEKYKKDRQWLRNKLKDLSFGMLQESVWITPYPVEKELKEFLDGKQVAGKVLVTVSSVLVGDQSELAGSIWKLDELNDLYLELCESWTEKQGKNVAKDAYEFEKKYFEVLINDPYLPKELLPKPWYGERARKVYVNEIRGVLNS